MLNRVQFSWQQVESLQWMRRRCDGGGGGGVGSRGGGGGGGSDGGGGGGREKAKARPGHARKK